VAPLISDRRIELMQSRPRLFEIISGEPEGPTGCPIRDAGCRDVLERFCSRIEAALQTSELGVLRVDWYAEVPDETSVGIGEAVKPGRGRSACTAHPLAGAARAGSSRRLRNG